MKFPLINEIPVTRNIINVFGGMNSTDSCAENEFSSMMNMTLDKYPSISTRNHRVKFLYEKIDSSVICVDDHIYFCKEASGKKYLFKDNKNTGIKLSENQFILFGNKIVCMDSKKIYDIEKNELTDLGFNIDVEHYGTINTFLSPCKENGDGFRPEIWEDGEKLTDGIKRYASSNGFIDVQQYSESAKMWTSIAEQYTFIHISSEIVEKIKEGDWIKIRVSYEGVVTEEDEKPYKLIDTVSMEKVSEFVYDHLICVHKKNEDGIIVKGKRSENSFIHEGHLVSHLRIIKIYREIPDITFGVSYQNRIWGVAGHELRACRLGDPTNWDAYNGISTDAYAATIGSPGEITASCVFNNMPMFFKTNSVIKVSVSSVGAHSYREYDLNGVQKGSDKSLVRIDDSLYYNGVDGIYRYNGSVPIKISNDLDRVRILSACGGTLDKKYYISSNDKKIYVYDTQKNAWTVEDGNYVTEFVPYTNGKENGLIIVSSDGFFSINGKFPKGEWILPIGGIGINKFAWNLESGNIGYESPDHKYVSRVTFSLDLEVGTEIELYVQYDSDGNWEHIHNMTGKGVRNHTYPLLPRRCNYFRYKLVGNGDAKILSITKTIEQGSEY